MQDIMFSTERLDYLHKVLAQRLGKSEAENACQSPYQMRVQLGKKRVASSGQNKQKNIHLFFCCNYNPLPKPNTDEAALYVGILNLYRFAIDSGPAIRYWDEILYCNLDSSIKSREQMSRKEYQETLELIQVLRAYISHNNSEKDGLLEERTLEAYQNWCHSILQKPLPETGNDYSKLLADLVQRSNKMCTLLETGIALIEGQRAEAKIRVLSVWENKILTFYCRAGVKSHIFKGQLLRMYCELKREGKFPETKNEYAQLEQDVVLWVEEYYTHTSRIAELKKAAPSDNDEKIRVQNELINLQAEATEWNTRAEAYVKGYMSVEMGDDQETIDEEIRKKRRELCYKKLVDDLKTYWQTEWIDKGKRTNMLPQNLIQKYIKFKLIDGLI